MSLKTGQNFTAFGGAFRYIVGKIDGDTVEYQAWDCRKHEKYYAQTTVENLTERLTRGHAEPFFQEVAA